MSDKPTTFKVTTTPENDLQAASDTDTTTSPTRTNNNNTGEPCSLVARSSSIDDDDDDDEGNRRQEEQGNHAVETSCEPRVPQQKQSLDVEYKLALIKERTVAITKGGTHAVIPGQSTIGIPSSSPITQTNALASPNTTIVGEAASLSPQEVQEIILAQQQLLRAHQEQQQHQRSQFNEILLRQQQSSASQLEAPPVTSGNQDLVPQDSDILVSARAVSVHSDASSLSFTEHPAPGEDQPPAMVAQVEEAQPAGFMDMIQHRNLQNYLVGILCLVLTVAVAVVVIVVFAAGAGSDPAPAPSVAPSPTIPTPTTVVPAPTEAMSPGQTAVPSAAPTEAPTMTSLILEVPIETRQGILKPNSAQAMAYKWLVDYPAIETFSEPRKRQLMAMATIYYSLRGNTTWPKTTADGDAIFYLNYSIPECQWGPVFVCNSDRQVRQLHVEEMNGRLVPAGTSSFRIPFEVSFLTELDSFQIDDCDLPFFSLPNFFPTQYMQGMQNLQQVSLFRNNLRGTIPSLMPLANLSRLESLDLNGNLLDGSIPTDIGVLSNSLKLLDLSWASVEGSLPSELGLLTQLTFLRLNNNNFYGEVPSELGSLTNLRFLSLARNPKVDCSTFTCPAGTTCVCGANE